MLLGSIPGNQTKTKTTPNPRMTESSIFQFSFNPNYIFFLNIKENVLVMSSFSNYAGLPQCVGGICKCYSAFFCICSTVTIHGCKFPMYHGKTFLWKTNFTTWKHTEAHCEDRMAVLPATLSPFEVNAKYLIAVQMHN